MAEGGGGGGGEDPQKLKRIAAAAYDYDNDPRWADYWSNVLIPPHLSSRPDVIDHFKRKFYQRFILVAENVSDGERVSAQQISSNDVDSFKFSSTCKSVTLGDVDSDARSSCGKQQQVHQLLQQQPQNSADQVFDKNTECPSGAESFHANQVFDKIHLKHIGDSSKATGKLPTENGPGAASKTPWRNLFADNRSPSQGYKLQYLEQQGDVIVLDDEDIDDLSEAFGFALIGYVAGKSTGKQAIRQCCNSWNVNYQLHFHNSGWLVIKFENEIDRNAVLEKGPYIIYGKPLLLKIMPELFDFKNDQLTQLNPLS